MAGEFQRRRRRVRNTIRNGADSRRSARETVPGKLTILSRLDTGPCLILGSSGVRSRLAKRFLEDTRFPHREIFYARVLYRVRIGQFREHEILVDLTLYIRCIRKCVKRRI